MSDVAWIQVKNIVLITTTAFCMYYISGWCWLLMLFYTTVSHKDEK